MCSFNGSNSKQASPKANSCVLPWPYCDPTADPTVTLLWPYCDPTAKTLAISLTAHFHPSCFNCATSVTTAWLPPPRIEAHPSPWKRLHWVPEDITKCLETESILRRKKRECIFGWPRGRQVVLRTVRRHSPSSHPFPPHFNVVVWMPGGRRKTKPTPAFATTLKWGGNGGGEAKAKRINDK